MLKTILIVDDNKDNLKLMEKQLKSNGYQVVPAVNGVEALALARKSAPDLIISDILMPVMDGFTLCRNWRTDQKLRRIPFIFYTATYTDSRDEQLAMSLGANRFIIKPAETESFLETIKSVLDTISLDTESIPPRPEMSDESILSKYNEVLINKLEQKVQSLKETNARLENEIEQKQVLEKSLRQTQETLQRVFASIAGGILITNLEGKIIDCNDNAVNMALYRNKNELTGKSVFDFLRDEEREQAIKILSQTVDEGTAFNHQYNIYRQDGSVIPVEVSSCSARDESGHPIFVVISFSNITERKQMEERIIELYEQEKRERQELMEEANARGLFIEVLAHELRTPLTPILVSSGMLHEQLEKLEANVRQKLADNIYIGTRMLVSRLEELLDLANYSRGTFKLSISQFDIEDVIRETATELKPSFKKQRQTLILEIPTVPAPVKGDRIRLTLVIANLLSNANKFSPPDSEIKVTLRRVNGEYQIDVSDRGSGITLQEQERLFKPYHRVEQDRQKFPGIGLGLAICKQIIEAHGGRISVKSLPGEGSTFSLNIPA